MTALLYFAYGSNMSTPRLRARVPSAAAVGIGYVEGHRLAWDKRSVSGGKCDLEATGDPADRVWGVIFEINANEEGRLDNAEGYPDHYDKKTVTVITEGGPQEASTYFALLKHPGLKPYAWYKQHVLKGAREHGLPAEYIAQIEAVASLPDPDIDRTARELSIY